MAKATDTTKGSTGRVTVDDARIDRLRDQYLSTPLTIDYERVRFMKKVYEENAGYQQIILRAKFLAHLLDNKRLYIDDNLFVGSMTGDLNGVYTYPEWSIAWMKEDDVIADSKTPEDREANEWVLKFWEKRGLKPRC